MKRTKIMLPEELRTRAHKRARRDAPSKVSKKDPFFSDEFVWNKKAPRDGSKDHDKYLRDDSL